MEFIPFERVSVQEAKAVLDGKPASPQPEKNWAQVRDASASTNTVLTAQVWTWLDGLPKEVRPKSLIRNFPRIANKLAELWRRPVQCEKYLDALILDHRGARNGFPPEVAKEIFFLKTHLNQGIAPAPQPDVWGRRL